MEPNSNAPLIEATVKSAINRIKNDPERSMRNIIDLALVVCNGRFQKKFLEAAQRMLEDENSSYYRIIPDLIENVDSKRISTFGINLGYNSCTNGARIIRKLEAEHHFNIPWCICLNINSEGYQNHKDDYFSFIEQGKQMGIYTWFINPCSDYTSVIELASHFMDCAFIVQAHPMDITNLMLSDFDEIYNVLFSVCLEEDIEQACNLLRQERFLYSVSYLYNKQNISYISSQDIFYDIGIMKSPFALICAESDCPVEIQLKIYDEILEMRKEQKLPTIPFDLIHDLLYIDEVISSDAVYITVDVNGICDSNLISDTNNEYSIFKQPLEDLLRILAFKS